MNINSENYNEKLMLAFVGGGINSAVGRTHFVASQMDHLFQLVSGCFSRKNEINIRTAIKFGLDKERVYKSIKELVNFEQNKIDALVLLTPQDQHYSDLRYCLENNIPVICEKALVSSFEEALNIKEILSRNNGFLKVTYNYTGYPMVREIRNKIRNGELGRILSVQIEMPQEGFIRRNADGKPIVPQEWRLKDGVIPTISLDLGIHLHHLMLFLTNERPVSLVANAKSYGNFKSVIDDVNILCEHTNNVTSNIWFSKSALGNRNGMKFRIYGSEAAIEWIQERPEIAYLYKNDGQRIILDRGDNNMDVAGDARYTRFKVGHPAGYIEAFANYYMDLYDDIRYFKENKKLRYNEYTFGIDESLDGLKFLEAAALSINERKWIDIDSVF